MGESLLMLAGGALAALAIERCWRAATQALALKAELLTAARAEAKDAREIAEASQATALQALSGVAELRGTVDKVALYAGVRGKAGQAQQQ